jgi:DNA-binding PadR family transcriptional regulator
MYTHIFEMNEDPQSRYEVRGRFRARFRGERKHACGERTQGEFEQSFRGREREGCERGFGGRERGAYERGFRGRGHGGFEGGFGGRGARGFERGFGRGRERLFDAGDVKLVILKLLSEQPSYGYQIIKAMEQRLSGGYTPSAGVIYPTLTMLEEEGLAAASTENNKRVYSVTAEGKQYLEGNRRRVEELFARIEEAGKGFERGRSPELMKAFMDLRGAVVARVSRESVTRQQIQKITEAIRAAAKAIDEL